MYVKYNNEHQQTADRLRHSRCNRLVYAEGYYSSSRDSCRQLCSQDGQLLIEH